MATKRGQRGGVSIFIVIFTALMVTVVTTSFVQLMVQNQQQASNNDLSQSAYDAAMAGVEDAKRLLVTLDRCERAGDSACVLGIKTKINANACDTTAYPGIATKVNGEFKVGPDEANQAYTCVKIDPDTPSVGSKLLASQEPKVLKLSSRQSFDTIRISWFSKNDLEGITGDKSASATDPPFFDQLPSTSGPSAWTNTAPPLLRAQLIQFEKGALRLNNFQKEGTSNARTAFLYPQLSGSVSGVQQYFTADSRRKTSGSNTPKLVTCDNADAYICSVDIKLPELKNDAGNDVSANREAYLQLAALYATGETSYEVRLFDGSTPRAFDNVQPTVDATGRAADLFRRVKAKVSIKSIELRGPDAALFVNQDFCKNFYVTDDKDDFGSSCTVSTP